MIAFSLHNRIFAAKEETRIYCERKLKVGVPQKLTLGSLLRCTFTTDNTKIRRDAACCILYAYDIAICTKLKSLYILQNKSTKTSNQNLKMDKKMKMKTHANKTIAVIIIKYMNWGLSHG